MTSTDIANSPDGGARIPAAPRVVFLAAAALLMVGTLLYLLATAGLLWPGALSGSGFLSFGRLTPAATGLVLGWLLLAAIGAASYVMPRIGAEPLDLRLVLPGALLVLAGSVGGSTASLLGFGEGGRFVESPWYAEVVLAAGLLVVAAAVTRSARRTDTLPIAGWYLIGALWWAFAAAAVVAVPGLSGIPAALQSRFGATVLVGLVPVAAGLGGLYFLVARLVPGAEFHPRLGPIGFWSLGFSWLWLSPATLQYGPTPEWLETIPVLFALGLVVAMLAVLADLAHATRGRWEALRANRSLQLALAGVVPFVLLVGQQLVTALRGPSGVVNFTDWVAAGDVLLLWGAGTLWLGALAAHALAGERGWNRAAGALHLGLAGTGLVVALVGFWISGLQQGYGWVAAVNGEIVAAGDAFRSSVTSLEAVRLTALVGLGLLTAGTLAFGAAALTAITSRPRADAGPVGAGSVAGATRVWIGALALFTLAGLSVFGLPAIDAGTTPSELASETRRFGASSAAAAGRDLYVSEGCWQCHTQQVRSVVADVGLGTVSVPGDYAYDPADLLGSRRIGPDLTHVAGRGWDAASLRDHLADPQRDRSWSVMPSYDYLDPSELDALAAYLASLE